MTIECSCGETFSNQNPLNRDVIIPLFHAMAGHTLSEVEARQPTSVEVKTRTRRRSGRTKGNVYARGSGGVLR